MKAFDSWGALILPSELLQTSYSGDGALDILGLARRPWLLNQNSHELRTPGIQPWTDGAPLIYKLELIQNTNSEDEAFDSWGALDC